MLANCPIVPTLPVIDMERARKFYALKLGLKLMEATSSEAWYQCGGNTKLYLYKRATPTKADNTAASFVVEDIISEVAELKQKGVVFEDYDVPGPKTVNNIAIMGNEKSAWFKDTEGNILAITQPVKSRVYQTAKSGSNG